MKKHLFLTALVLALVMCFSLGVCAHEQGNVVTMGEDDPNQYVFTDALKGYVPTNDLWIGTLDQWIAAGNKVGDTGTVFVNGEGIHGDDIIITNGVVGITLAVETRNPWGYPGGSVLDAGRVNNMVGGRDTIWAAEVLVDGWDSWAPGPNSGVITYDLVNYDFAAKKEVKTGGLPAVKVDRDYLVGGADFSIVTYYSMEKGAEYAYMFTEFTNNGEKTDDMSNRFAMTNKGDDGGAMFGGDASSATGAYSGMVASYGKSDKNTFFTALIMPGNVERFNAVTGEKLPGIVEPSRVGGSVGYKCVRVDNRGNFKSDDPAATFASFEKNEQRTYGLYLYIDDVSTPAGALNLIAKVRNAEMIDVAGTAPANSTIIVKAGGKAFGWFEADKDGKFAFQLPKNTAAYTAYVEGKGVANGAAVTIPAEGSKTLALTSGAAKEKVTINLKDDKGNKIYGKVEVPGAYPTVRYNGDSVFNAKETGKVEIEVAPGTEKVVVYGQGYWFYSEPQELALEANKKSYDVVVPIKINLEKGWLSGDVHHHADKNDAFAHPEDLVPSFAASDVDVVFVTDHDFTTNNKKAYELSKQYGMTGFVPSEEISCSWAHFNVLPLDVPSYNWFLDENADNAEIMNQFADLQDFVDQTHKTGAAITANHPWYDYGLFTAQDNDAIPGGYTDDYDTVEINACNADSETTATIASLAELWTGYLDQNTFMDTDVEVKKPHYVVGGSDTHDVIYPGFSGKADYTSDLFLENEDEDFVAKESGYNLEEYGNVRNMAWYATGKIRTVAYIGEETNDIVKNGLAYTNALVNGNSYVTFGPILDLDTKALPGEYYKGDKFEVSFGFESLNKINEVLVLRGDATGSYNWASYWEYAKNDQAEELTACNVDLAASITDPAKVAELKGKFTYKMDVKPGQYTWVAFIVIDEYDNFALTNPYWVGNTFPDVDLDAWYAPAVTALQELAIVNGNDKGMFEPAKNVTRAEFAQMLYKVAGGKDAVTEGKAVEFSDLNGYGWAKPAIDYLTAEGVITGYPDGTFAPGRHISRAEMVVMIYRFLGFNEELDASFVDVQPSSWYYDAVMVLGGLGYVNGYGDGTFKPNANATKAEAAQIIYNFLK